MRKKINVLPIIVACLLMILQRVLFSAVTAPTCEQNPGRFLIYSFLQVISNAGIGIIPLYMGYYFQNFEGRKVYKYLANFSLIYLFCGYVSNIYFYVQSSSLNLRDYWIAFFPISQNYFVYAVSCVLLFCSAPLLVKRLNDLSLKYIKQLIFFTTMGFSVLPTVFNKDLWGFQKGQNVLWIFYLFLLGYCLKRLKWFDKVKFSFLHTIFSLLLLFFSIILMIHVSLVLRGNTSTAMRFTLPYTVLSLYYLVSLFSFLQHLKVPMWLKVNGQIIGTLLVVVQVLLNWPLNNYRISIFMKQTFPNSGRDWIINLIQFFIYYLVAIILLFFISLIIQKNSKYQRFASWLSFDSLDDLNNNGKKILSWLIDKRKIFNVALLFYILTFSQLFILLPRNTKREGINNVIQIFVHSQSRIVLTVLIVMGFFLLLLLLTNRFWYALSVTFFIDLLLTISSVLKVKMREEPIFPSDLKMLNSISELLSMVSPLLISIAAIFLLFLTVISMVVQRKLQKQYSLKIKWRGRLTGIITILVLFSGVFFINHKNSPSYLLFNLFKVNKTFFNQQETVKENGPVIQFLINIDIKVMDRPADYSKEKIDTIMKKYDVEAAKINRSRLDWVNNQTIILNLSESFSDPARVPNLQLSKDPIPFIKQQIQETTGGQMLSVGYGGGTANMEWEGLTGLDVSNLAPSLVTPYNQLVDNQKISPNLTNLFDEKIAIHPFTANLYNRKSVFKKFGFDRFYYFDSPNKLTYTDKIDNSPRVSDESAYNETLKVLKSNTSTSQFIQLSTMQNHMPYQNYYESYDYDAQGSAILNSRKQELRTYMQGIHYTDEAVKKFIGEIDQIEKPITFVFYGDHLPGIYSGNDANKYGLEQHETDFFIYNNRYSREQYKKIDKSIVSTSNFAALALKQANIKVTPYYALLTQVAEQLPATTTDPGSSVSNRFNGKQVFVTDINKIISSGSLTKKQKELLSDYKQIQYDLVAGNQYSAKWAQNKWN